MKIINTVELAKKYPCFAYDGCHKIYLIENVREKNEAEGNDYEIRPICELARTFESSCELRFINDWDLTQSFAEQFEKVEVM